MNDSHADEPWRIAGSRSAPFETHPCPCRATHAPSVPWTHRHHIWPLYADGPDSPENTVYVCPATHDWIHVIIRVFEKEGITSRQRDWPYYAYEIAKQGWELMRAWQSRKTELSSESLVSSAASEVDFSSE